LDHYFSEGILISNEGNFQWGNASVSFYDTENDILIESVFQEVNNRPLGDVLQSITIEGDYAYLVLNNSARIEVVYKNSFELVGSITGFISPRYIHIVNNEKAYVSDLYSNKIAVVDLVSLEITNYIDCTGWTEEMHQLNNEVYVLNKTENSLYKIDVATDAITSVLVLDFEVNSFKICSQSRIWLAGSKNDMGIVECMNPQSGEIEYSYNFVGENPSELYVSESGSDVYFLSNGVWHINEFTDEIISVPIIPANERLFYGLSVHQDKIYIADAINYVQQGTVWVYDLQATLLQEFKVGIIPSEFYFINP
jgi:DNA-binding beta-propeller fold protein YncE